MPQIELSAGVIEYADTGGEGPVVVLMGGLVIGPSLWREVVADLRKDFRCIVPTLPMGAHKIPVRCDFALSPHSVAMLLGEFLERMNLEGITLVENDTGRAQTLASELPDRIGRLVIASCEAFDNYPPGLPGRSVALFAKIPGGLAMLALQMRLRFIRRLPLAFGWMAKRPIPDKVMDEWLQPFISNPAIRKDLERYLKAASRNEMVHAAEGLRSFNRPSLVVWAAEDRVMSKVHGRRLAELLPRGRYMEIPDSYTLIPEDQPRLLASAIRGFIFDA
jgi:pimeloyl-ACP methyl ester carboxylesterase